MKEVADFLLKVRESVDAGTKPKKEEEDDDKKQMPDKERKEYRKPLEDEEDSKVDESKLNDTTNNDVSKFNDTTKIISEAPKIEEEHKEEQDKEKEDKEDKEEGSVEAESEEYVSEEEDNEEIYKTESNNILQLAQERKILDENLIERF
eukprot:CAMPEP_0116974576 /NCGR_PEP_ID=MMETSP0467-20121206/55262_1 /TAXON_ID=283647 /ORGANISM="Mesodinium pulex, Strain SPMC105" /LENGTH=148 /DNA_ID=CAMNT_0004666769 /DNA_START=151 /DNA_END=597 /DNA_ORIENTATION=-